MKIIPSVVLAVMLGASTLFAGDEENAKAVVVKDWQLAAAGKFAECLALRTPDFTEKNDDGPTRNYEQTKWQLTSLDGKHPEEFMLFLMTLNGAKIQAEMMPQIREKASDPKFVQYYKKTCSQLRFVGFHLVRCTEGCESGQVVQQDPPVLFAFCASESKLHQPAPAEVFP